MTCYLSVTRKGWGREHAIVPAPTRSRLTDSSAEWALSHAELSLEEGLDSNWTRRRRLGGGVSRIKSLSMSATAAAITICFVPEETVKNTWVSAENSPFLSSSSKNKQCFMPSRPRLRLREEEMKLSFRVKDRAAVALHTHWHWHRWSVISFWAQGAVTGIVVLLTGTDGLVVRSIFRGGRSVWVIKTHMLP